MIYISTSACFFLGRAVEWNLEVKRAGTGALSGWVTEWEVEHYEPKKIGNLRMGVHSVLGLNHNIIQKIE